MKEIKLFYLEDCPYCHNAERALAEPAKEDPVYGEDKLYEADPSENYAGCKRKVKTALDTVLEKCDSAE